MTNFHLYSYATIAEAEAKIFSNKKCIRNVLQARPAFESPRPCFGFIWNNFDNNVRTNNQYTVKYDSKIYINRNRNWAINNNRKNYCALSDEEIDIYIKFVSQIAGDDFQIEVSPYESSKSDNAFKGIIVRVKTENNLFKRIMVVCNMIRYMYEWPEAYNIKQMLLAYKNHLFFDDFGQIFCLYESLMQNTYDQKVSSCKLQGACYIHPYTTEQLHELLQNIDITHEAACYLEFQVFKPIVNKAAQKENANNLWALNKYNCYKSDLYVKPGCEEMDEEILNKVTKLYRFITMNECIDS